MGFLLFVFNTERAQSSCRLHDCSLVSFCLPLLGADPAEGTPCPGNKGPCPLLSQGARAGPSPAQGPLQAQEVTGLLQLGGYRRRTFLQRCLGEAHFPWWITNEDKGSFSSV